MSNSEIHYGVRYFDSDHVSDFDTDAHRAAGENRVLNAKKVRAELVCRRVTYGTNVEAGRLPSQSTEQIP